MMQRCLAILTEAGSPPPIRQIWGFGMGWTTPAQVNQGLSLGPELDVHKVPMSVPCHLEVKPLTRMRQESSPKGFRGGTWNSKQILVLHERERAALNAFPAACQTSKGLIVASPPQLLTPSPGSAGCMWKSGGGVQISAEHEMQSDLS